MGFRKDFVWGAAAASYQIEGAAFEDGKGLSVWDMMCRKEGAIWQKDDGFTACDHVHRYAEDVGIMKQIGLHAYRLSISWPRVMPAGTGAVNAKGLDFYQRLIDALLEAGVQPWVTLFHWDFPYDLYGRGGWLNPDSPKWFEDYTHVVAAALGDRVKHWMTLNEPQCFIGLGHKEGRHAPGDKLGFREVLRAGHHALLAHGRAVQAIRQHVPDSQIGYAPVGMVHYPAEDTPACADACRRSMFRVTANSCWNNTWWMDPVFLGGYPEQGLETFGDAAPAFTDEEMKTIHQPVDFFGVNVYSGQPMKVGPGGEAVPASHGIGPDLTAFRWNVTPECLYWGPKLFQERYGNPVVITENGLSSMDWVALDGKVHDPMRIDFLRRYLLQLERAADDGVDIRGYFQWSILDNFEWAEGYKERFGLVYVDYNTQERILKDSAHWYAEVIQSNGERLHRD